MPRKSMENLEDRGKGPWDSVMVDIQSSRSTDCLVPRGNLNASCGFG